MSIKEIEEKLNQTIEPYLKAEREGQADSAPFWAALGNSYRGLERKPEAVWAYQKSLTMNPWNREVRANLSHLQEELLVPKSYPFLPPETLFYQLFALFFILFFFSSRFPKLRAGFGLFSLLTLLWIAFNTWFMPAEGIIMTPSDMTQLPTVFSPKVSSSPLKPGLKVEVLSYEEEGEWLKIRDETGKIGFVPFNAIKVI